MTIMPLLTVVTTLVVTILNRLRDYMEQTVSVC